ncbi:MAG: hypothetical protein AMXMBFR84_35180 [Candidatus Hydrogenedentota bacterium]
MNWHPRSATQEPTKPLAQYNTNQAQDLWEDNAIISPLIRQDNPRTEFRFKFKRQSKPQTGDRP